jgi:hypothetical protein
MDPDFQLRLKKARAILEKNWMGDYTRPSSLLYPHQWSWDSGFIAIGYSTYDQKRAQQEITSLLKGQWKNGMIPHIVYSPRDASKYFPDAEFWNARRAENAPKGVQTSGITQPPVHATAVRCIFDRAKDKGQAKEFLKNVYPKLLGSHRFYYMERDPDNEGLAYIRHPWESGIDNSPTWDFPLSRILLGDLPEFKRRDLKKGVSKKERPKDWDYNRYVYLVELFKQHGYDETKIFDECPFLVQDVFINSILVKADQDLAIIGDILGEDVSQLQGWEKKTRSAINKKLWHRGHGIFDAFDLMANKMIEVDTAAGFTPLYAKIPSDHQAQRLLRYLDSKSFCTMHEHKCYSIPNYNMLGEYFDPSNYWRGPIWINMNWMLYHGLKNYGFKEKALSVKGDVIELVRRYGFYEYYDPIKGKGYGSKNFSWTAALFLDIVHEGDARN